MMKKLITLVTTIALSLGMITTIAPSTVEANTPTKKEQNITRNSTKVNEAQYDKVIMVYMIGSDLETESQFGVDDIREMIEADFGKNNIIVLQTGGAKRWHTVDGTKISNKQLQRYVITNGEFKLIESIENDNMGKAETLKDFIKFTETNYSAKETSLVLWSHGAGPVYGFGTDEKHMDDSLSLEELKEALSETKKLDSIVFDACLMGNLETAYALSDYADYMLASSDFAPGSGLSYKEYIEAMKNKSASMLNVENLKSFTVGEHDTLSLVDLSKVKSLMEAVAKEIGEASSKEIFEAATKSIAYGVLEEEQTYSDTFDIKGIVNELGDDHNTIAKLEAAVVANYTSDGFKESSGLSLFVPMKDDYGVEEARTTMDELSLPEGYLNKIFTLNKTVSMDNKLNVPVSITDSMIEDLMNSGEWNDYGYDDKEWNTEGQDDLYDGEWDFDEEADEFAGFQNEEWFEYDDENHNDFYRKESFIQAIIDYLYELLFPMDYGYDY